MHSSDPVSGSRIDDPEVMLMGGILGFHDLGELLRGFMFVDVSLDYIDVK